MSVWVCLQNAVVTAANSHINNYSKNIISLQPVGPLSSVGPWASAPWSPCINAPLPTAYMIIPEQIYTGGAGEGGGFLECAATATTNISRAFECWAASSLATDTGENQSAVPCDNDVIISDWVRPIGLRHLEFHARTLCVYIYIYIYIYIYTHTHTHTHTHR